MTAMNLTVSKGITANHPRIRTFKRYAEMAEREHLLRSVELRGDDQQIDVHVWFEHIEPEIVFDNIGEACTYLQLMAETAKFGRTQERKRRQEKTEKMSSGNSEN